MQTPQPRSKSIGLSVRRQLVAALLALVVLPALGVALGEPRELAGVGIVLATVWLAMAGVGLLRQRGARGDD